MRITRAGYHNAVSEAMSDSNKAQSRLMAKSIASGDDCNLGSEMQKLNGKSQSIPNAMYRACGEEDMAEIFAHKYKNLYTSVSYTQNEMDSLLNDVYKGINNIYCTGLCYKAHDVIPEQIRHAVSRLNCDKNDGSSGLSTDHIIISSEKFHAHLAFYSLPCYVMRICSC